MGVKTGTYHKSLLNTRLLKGEYCFQIREDSIRVCILFSTHAILVRTHLIPETSFVFIHMQNKRHSLNTLESLGDIFYKSLCPWPISSLLLQLFLIESAQYIWEQVLYENSNTDSGMFFTVFDVFVIACILTLFFIFYISLKIHKLYLFHTSSIAHQCKRTVPFCHIWSVSIIHNSPCDLIMNNFEQASDHRSWYDGMQSPIKE